MRMFSVFARNGGFITFEFLWLTTISPRNAPLGSSRQRKMVKAYSVLFFITEMVQLLTDSWCAAKAFLTRTIPFDHWGEYENC